MLILPNRYSLTDISNNLTPAYPSVTRVICPVFKTVANTPSGVTTKTVNGALALSVDYGNDLGFTFPSWVDTGEASVLLVQQRATSVANGWLEIGSSGQPDFFPYSNGSIYLDAFATSRWMAGASVPSGKSVTKKHTIILSSKQGKQLATWDGKTWATGTASYRLPTTLRLLGAGPSYLTFDGYLYLAVFFNRFLSLAEHKSLAQNPWQIFEPSTVPFYFGAATSGSETLTQSTRFNNSNSFYAPIVGVGAVSLLPPAISNSSSIYAPTVTVGSVTLSASRLNNSSAFYSPTLSVGSVSLSPGLLNNANTIYAPIVTTGALSLAQSSRFDNSNVIYSASLTPGSVTLSPSLFSNTGSLYPPVVTNGGTLLQQSSRFNNTNAFYGPAITTGAVTLTASLFSNSGAFYSATVYAGSVSLLPSLFSNASLIYSPVVTQGAATLLPDLLTNTGAFYGHTVSTGPVTLSVSLFSNTQAFYGPTVTTVEPQTLVQSSVFENGNIFYVPRVSEGLTLSPADIEAIADAVWAKALEGLRADEMMRIMFAALAGKREGLGTATEFYMDVSGTTPRITLTPDQYGNGTPIVNGGA